jgi:uncharacterized alkaline shock family protein YloU
MRAGTRVIFSILMVIFIAVCAYVFCVSMGFIDGFVFTMDDGTELYERYIISVVAAILAVTAFCLLFFRAGKKERTGNRVVLSQTEGTRISVTTDAIKELATNYLKGIEGVTIQNIHIKPVSEKGIAVNSALSVQREIQIPQITQKITEEIKAYIELYSGAAVENVNLSIQPQKNNVGNNI